MRAGVRLISREGRLTLAGILVLVGCEPLLAAVPEQVVTIQTGLLRREIAVEQGRLRTSRFVNLATRSELVVSDDEEFAFRLLDGREVTSRAYRVASRQTVQTAGGEQRTTLTLLPDDPSLPLVTAEYRSRSGDPFLRKRLHLAGKALVDTVAVESLRVAGRGECGGFGQPLFLDREWFFGLEYPAGTNALHQGQLRCSHSPGRSDIVTPWAVIGGRSQADARLEDEFGRYLDTLRRPLPPCLQYNSWFDVRGKDVTPERMAATLEAFRARLLEPFGLAFDAFVLDDGWQAPRSLWSYKPNWPNGLAELARRLERQGCRLGLWLPLNSYRAAPGPVEKEWEAAPGAKHYYCLDGARYRAALEPVLRRLIANGNLSYLKHDFNFLRCAADGHGHLPTERHGLEANVDGQLELLRLERSLQPDIRLNLTSNIWLSPWWLLDADFLWMGGGDEGEEWGFPQPSARAAQMTYRDGELYRRLQVERVQVPLSVLMTHGIAYGRLSHATTADSLRDWSDYVMMFLGRGTLLEELYISPELLPEGYWPILGRALRWAQANAEAFRWTRMVGGRPLEGEAYGYLHWSDRKGILCVRNPSHRPADLAVALVDRPRHLPPVSRWEPVMVYPQRCRLAAVAGTGDGTLALRLPAASVTVVELYAELPKVLESIPGGRFDVVEEASGRRLIAYGDPGARPVQAIGESVDGQKEWRGTFELPPGTAAATLELVRQPAGGAAVRVARSGPVPIATRQAAPRPADWDILRYRLDDRAGDLQVVCTLPPSPFWPQLGTVDAILRLRVPLQEAWSRLLPAQMTVPEWPWLPEPTTIVEETVLVDAKVLSRRRRPVESAAWVLVLGIVPVMVCAGISSSAVRGRSLWTRWSIGLALSLVFVAMYMLTPLGAALARALH